MHELNPFPMLVTLHNAYVNPAESVQERCINAAVHGWAEGHLSAAGHPSPSDTDKSMSSPPFPASEENERLRAIVVEAVDRFQEGQDVAAVTYAAALGWEAGVEEGLVCSGCAVENASHPFARAMRGNGMEIEFRLGRHAAGYLRACRRNGCHP